MSRRHRHNGRRRCYWQPLLCKSRGLCARSIYPWYRQVLYNLIDTPSVLVALLKFIFLRCRLFAIFTVSVPIAAQSRSIWFLGFILLASRWCSDQLLWFLCLDHRNARKLLCFNPSAKFGETCRLLLVMLPWSTIYSWRPSRLLLLMISLQTYPLLITSIFALIPCTVVLPNED